MHRSTKTPRTPPGGWPKDDVKKVKDRYDSPVPDDPFEDDLDRTTSKFTKNRRPPSVGSLASITSKTSRTTITSRPDSTDSLSRSRARVQRQVIHTEDDLRRRPPSSGTTGIRSPTPPTPPLSPTPPISPSPPPAIAPSRRPLTTSTTFTSISRAPPRRKTSPDSDDSSAERYRRYSNQKYYDWRSEDSDDGRPIRTGHNHNGKKCDLCDAAKNGVPKRRPLTLEQLSLKSSSKPARPASIVVRQRSLSDPDPCDYTDKFVTKRKERRSRIK